MDQRMQMIADLQRRAALLPAEVDAWKALTEGNVEGMGLHRTQIRTIDLMFDELEAVHQDLLAELDPTLEAQAFAELRSQLEAELSGAHGLMAIFRHVLVQRLEDGSRRAVLDLADLVSAGCYRDYIKTARKWDVLAEGQFREPPLTFLNARTSPAAITRRHTFGGFGFDLESYEEMTLPISVISLRFHDTTGVWSLCSLYHETGHLLEQDLKLSGEVSGLLEGDLAGTASAEGLFLWKFWTREMLADAFGVLLGGAGYAYGLADMLFLPGADVLRIMPGDKHPVPYVRVHLLGALLRRAGVDELADVADEIETAWLQYYGPPPDDLVPYLDECALVAEVLLDRSLFARLAGRRLLDLAPSMAEDQQLAAELADHLLGGDEPEARNYPVRLVPAAARLAVQGVTEDHAAAYAAIHERALAFFAEIPRPEFMAAPRTLEFDQEQYLRSLAQSLRFGQSTEKEEDDD
jgi:hypothetical protein